MPLVFLRDAGNMPVHECPACTRTVRGCVIVCVSAKVKLPSTPAREVRPHPQPRGTDTHAALDPRVPRAASTGHPVRSCSTWIPGLTAYRSQRELAAIGMEASHALSDVKMLRSVGQRQTGSSSSRRGQMWSPRHADGTLINGAHNAAQNEA